jgi:hypothetical protein
MTMTTFALVSELQAWHHAIFKHWTYIYTFEMADYLQAHPRHETVFEIKMTRNTSAALVLETLIVESPRNEPSLQCSGRDPLG